MTLIVAVGLLLCCAALIYGSCELFVNGIEWLGQKWHVGATAVGTILAAFGTALPETVVTLMAVLPGRNGAEKDIGVGAALGGPLVLSTLAYGVVGLLALGRPRGARRAAALDADVGPLAFDQLVFLATFSAKVLLGLFAWSLKPYAAGAFVLIYGAYLVHELNRPESQAEAVTIEPLIFARRQAVPSLTLVLAQVGLAVGVIAWAAHLFVVQLQTLGQLSGVAPHVVALVLSPVATELPEILNACIWVRQGKQRLALANISGSMMIQATLPSAMGMALTPWLFDGPLLVAAAVTMLAIVMMRLALVRGRLTAQNLLMGPPLYALFLLYLVLHGGHAPPG
jgi:cation:H+ antiporter